MTFHRARNCRGKDKTHENDGFPCQQEASDSPDTVLTGFLHSRRSVHKIRLDANIQIIALDREILN